MITKSGISWTSNGTIIVASSITKSAWRPGKRIRANAKAASDEKVSESSVVVVATKAVFRK